jgi:hypothetical protein
MFNGDYSLVNKVQESGLREPFRLRKICRAEADLRSPQRERRHLSILQSCLGCDLIVCWEHGWKKCSIEVMELKILIKELVHIKWDGQSFSYIPLEAQLRILQNMGREKYFRLPKPGKNPREVEISNDARLRLLQAKDTRRTIFWRCSTIEYKPF